MSIVVASVTPEVSERQYGFSLPSHSAFIFTFNTGYRIKVGEQWGESGEEIEHATHMDATLVPAAGRKYQITVNMFQVTYRISLRANV